jgi:hypothetical protein
MAGSVNGVSEEDDFVQPAPPAYLVPAAGFKVLHLWGDYSRGQFEPERSPFMIWELGGGQ